MSAIVVTGASAGIGRATALAFAAEGADVALISRNGERLAQLQREIEAAGAKALALPLDVADSAALEAAADRIEATLGPIDVWVSNAMVSVFSPMAQMTAESSGAARFCCATSATATPACSASTTATSRRRLSPIPSSGSGTPASTP